MAKYFISIFILFTSTLHAADTFDVEAFDLELGLKAGKAEEVCSEEEKADEEPSEKAMKGLLLSQLSNLAFAVSTGLITHEVWDNAVDGWFALEVAGSMAMVGFLECLLSCCSSRKLIKATAKLSAWSLMALTTCLWAQLMVLGLPYLHGESYGAAFAKDAIEFDRSSAIGSNTSFNYTAISDPQLYWHGAPTTNLDQAEALHEVGLRDNSAFITLNGDITEYFHPHQLRDVVKKYYPVRNIRIPIMLGLGNHDVTNNVGDCSGPWWSILTSKDNWCAEYAKHILQDFVTHNPQIISFDQGSLAYSWEVGDLHFVQLHNKLTYSDSRIDLTSPEEWLIADLEYAKRIGKSVIINQHYPSTNELSEFLTAQEATHVAAVFAGHIHSFSGKKGNIKVLDAKIPLFLSGSAEYNSFLTVQYHAKARKLKVYKENSKTRSRRHVSTVKLR